MQTYGDPIFKERWVAWSLTLVPIGLAFLGLGLILLSL